MFKARPQQWKMAFKNIETWSKELMPQLLYTERIVNSFPCAFFLSLKTVYIDTLDCGKLQVKPVGKLLVYI